ncbi:hypothetical protein TSAR_001111 [Trichomalopsis sarcophagae]|uniref:Uncharacterized protein n=1 Tax=Trichomalopsis sarcophagae TaxID=543379 RepID=A0A232ERR9_9HYME|nr:hypothetical protein TSAR_001111 [Trichomalopsis sarcophagae]
MKGSMRWPISGGFSKAGAAANPLRLVYCPPVGNKMSVPTLSSTYSPRSRICASLKKREPLSLFSFYITR